jgi:cell wall-associated NlpC family hydrolase
MNALLTEMRDGHVARARLLHPLRAAVVHESFDWIATPYVNCGYVKGLRGAVDCAMLLVGVFANAGLIPKDFDPRPYNPDWHLHQSEERYLAGLENFAHIVGAPKAGDIALYRFGKTASHGAIVISDDLIIHAHKHAGQVELCERRLLEPQHFDSFWSVFS